MITAIIFAAAIAGGPTAPLPAHRQEAPYSDALWAEYAEAMSDFVYSVGGCERYIPAQQVNDMLRKMVGPDHADGPESIAHLVVNRFVDGREASMFREFDETQCTRLIKAVTERFTSAADALPASPEPMSTPQGPR